MLPLQWQSIQGRPLSILCLGAHPDDIEIGCGGTILKLIDEIEQVSVRWIVFSGTGERRKEAQVSAELFLEKAISRKIAVHDCRDGFFPYDGGRVKDIFEQAKEEIQPDVIFTQYRDDAHQDHRELCGLTWNTFRDHLILEYEIPKYDGDLGRPNLFVSLDDTILRRKVDLLLEAYRSQTRRHWFTEETFFALARLRGVESSHESDYAEAFHCRKAMIEI